jgi:AmmeMemoRadiSam system protein A
MLSKDSRRTLIDIARRSVTAAIKGEELPGVKPKNEELQERCGAFVTLKTNGNLRGCLGRFTSDMPLWKTVQVMAAAAATEDPRFFGNRLRPEELEQLNIEISVLSPLQKTDDPLSIELGRDGIFIKRGIHTGCFLPQVATETGWSKREFLSNCCAHKAGLPPDAWQDPDTEVYTFTAEIIDEKDF